ncbi:hypothetical protein [Aminobacter sp. MDW-2]|jgi:hypothetical protein|uniref:hypothetical protein n=1 Tax=Aminobacter sp. MDW-2 TaxID=2666139 RepID=UPI0012AFAB00|nr:hypothetical protein [Aminobacter sp. MDW-2]MRX33241.1 hypothetical protein [Aminobacter sp. MDW-2]QNH36860.1 hypothetical protein H5P29_13720 [Aminobacter sp. MDW-2]
MGLHLKIEGVSPEDKQRGIAAAEAVLHAAGMTADRACAGMWALECWDDDGFQGELSDEDSKAARVWLDAEAAAIDACCVGWPEDKKPGMSSLEYYRDGESLPH